MFTEQSHNYTDSFKINEHFFDDKSEFTTELKSNIKDKRISKENSLNKTMTINNDTAETFFRPKTSYAQDWKGSDMKKKTKWVNKNITKEYTNSFILQYVNEPHRTVIQDRKNKAREERKAARFVMF